MRQNSNAKVCTVENLYYIKKLRCLSLILGYARVILAFVSFYYMPTSPYTAGFLYLLSGLLDAFDGHAARTLNQGIDVFITRKENFERQ